MGKIILVFEIKSQTWINANRRSIHFLVILCAKIQILKAKSQKVKFVLKELEKYKLKNLNLNVMHFLQEKSHYFLNAPRTLIFGNLAGAWIHSLLTMGFPTSKLGAPAPPPNFLKNNFQWSQPPPNFGLFLIHYSHKIFNSIHKSHKNHNNGTIHSRYTTTD